jgi:hypothetical protein
MNPRQIGGRCYFRIEAHVAPVYDRQWVLSLFRRKQICGPAEKSLQGIVIPILAPASSIL